MVERVSECVCVCAYVRACVRACVQERAIRIRINDYYMHSLYTVCVCECVCVQVRLANCEKKLARQKDNNKKLELFEEGERDGRRGGWRASCSVVKQPGMLSSPVDSI